MAISTGPVTLIIGGSGTLGKRVVRRLQCEGRRIRVMTRRPDCCAGFRELGVDLVEGDLLDSESVRTACQGVDKVVAASHSLFGRGRYASRAVDGTGCERLIELAVAAGVRRVVYVSVHGAHREHPVAFWRTKARTEEYLRRSGLPHTILRPTAFMDFHAEVLIGRPMRESRAVTWFGRGDNPRNLVAADDVAKFVVLGLNDDRPRSEAIEVGGPENLSNLDVVQHYEQLLQRKARLKRLPLAIGRGLRATLGLAHAGLGDVVHCALLAETSDQRLDGASIAAPHGITPVPLSAWLRRDVRGSG
jgi:uncharacterized protein YbjT (DUF2867 family)